MLSMCGVEEVNQKPSLMQYVQPANDICTSGCYVEETGRIAGSTLLVEVLPMSSNHGGGWNSGTRLKLPLQHAFHFMHILKKYYMYSISCRFDSINFIGFA